MMSSLRVKTPKDLPGTPMASNSPRPDVGEIDISAPFQSVKAAVSLFTENVSPKAASHVTKKNKLEERVLEKETQHYMITRELDCYKEQLKNADAIKFQAQRDLVRANRTLEHLTKKLEAVTESKQASVKAIDDAKLRLKLLEEQRSLRAQRGNDAWKEDMEAEREAYKACSAELLDVKQMVANVRHDYEAALEDKQIVFQRMEDAQQTTQVNQEKQSQLLQEVTILRETLDQLKLASRRAEEEHSMSVEEMESCLLACKSAKEESEMEVKRMKKECQPNEVLEQKLEETMKEVKVLQDRLGEIQSSDLNSIQTMSLELDSARQKLLEVTAEEESVRSGVNAIKQQLEEAKKERAESEQMALKAEGRLKELQAELEKKKAEFNTALSASTENLSDEAKEARLEGEDYKSVGLLKQESKAAKHQSKETEEKLTIALKKAEEAKAAKKRAEEQLHNQLGGKGADSKETRSVTIIRLPVEQFESLKKKIKEFGCQANVDVATAMEQVENINMSDKELSQKLDEVLKENEALQSEICNALKRAEAADAAKRMVELELSKQRDEENEAGQSSNSPEQT